MWKKNLIFNIKQDKFIYNFKNRNKGYIIGGTRTLPIYPKLWNLFTHTLY